MSICICICASTHGGGAGGAGDAMGRAEELTSAGLRAACRASPLLIRQAGARGKSGQKARKNKITCRNLLMSMKY